MVLPPYSAYFYSLTNYKYHKIITEILADNLKDILILDGLEFMPADLEFYENSDHLNSHGAKVFTKKLDSILKLSL